MQPSGGSTPLPPSPLPPPPYQQTYSPETGLSFTPAAASAPAAPQAAHRKTPAKVIGPIIFVIVFSVAILAGLGVFDPLFNPAGTQPSVRVTQTSASHTCPLSGAPTETFLFTLVNDGSIHAYASIGFYLNDAQVTSHTYYAAVGTSTPYSITASLASCPPVGSTFYLDILSVTAA